MCTHADTCTLRLTLTVNIKTYDPQGRDEVLGIQWAMLTAQGTRRVWSSPAAPHAPLGLPHPGLWPASSTLRILGTEMADPGRQRVCGSLEHNSACGRRGHGASAEGFQRPPLPSLPTWPGSDVWSCPRGGAAARHWAGLEQRGHCVTFSCECLAGTTLLGRTAHKVPLGMA